MKKLLLLSLVLTNVTSLLQAAHLARAARMAGRNPHMLPITTVLTRHCRTQPTNNAITQQPTSTSNSVTNPNHLSNIQIIKFLLEKCKGNYYLLSDEDRKILEKEQNKLIAKTEMGNFYRRLSEENFKIKEKKEIERLREQKVLKEAMLNFNLCASSLLVGFLSVTSAGGNPVSCLIMGGGCYIIGNVLSGFFMNTVFPEKLERSLHSWEIEEFKYAKEYNTPVRLLRYLNYRTSANS